MIPFSTLHIHCSKLLDRYGMNLDGPLYGTVIPCLEFSIEFQSNKLIYQKEYTKRQQIIYVLIQHLHDREGWGYRKISQWLNQSGIKTLRGKNWFSSSVISVLKRKHERDLMNEQIRNQHFPSKVSRFEVNYYIFDWFQSKYLLKVHNWMYVKLSLNQYKIISISEIKSCS